MEENAGWGKAQQDRQMTEDKVIDRHGATDTTGGFREVAVENKSHNSEPPANSLSPGGFSDGAGRSHSNQDDTTLALAGGDVSFTQLFQSMSAKQAAEPQQPQEETEASWKDAVSDKQQKGSSVSDFSTGSSSPGEFTAMFQSIRESSPVFDEGGSSSYTGNSRSPEPNAIGGGFTRLLRTLSDDDVTVSPFEMPSGATEKPAPREPGEFTQIVSRSVMREALLREQQTSAAPEAPAALSRPGEIPQAGSAGRQNSSAVVPPLAMPMPSGPSLQILEPTMPSSAVSHSALERVSVGRWQEYLPLLIMANLAISLFTLAMVGIILLHQH
jgi:hypothetical protein